MTQPPIREDEIQAYVDGRLGGRERGRVRDALDGDTALRAEVEADVAAMAELRAALRGDVVTGDPTTEQLMRDLRTKLVGMRYRRHLRHAAAAAVLIAVGWFGHLLTDRMTGVPDGIQLAVTAHELFANSAYPASTRPPPAIEDMEVLFTQLLGTPIGIPDLDTIGLTLVSGRIIELEGGPVVQVLYQDSRAERFSIYLAATHEPLPEDPAIHLVEVDGLTAGYWNDGNLLITLVADEPEEQLLALAMEIADEVPPGPAPAGGEPQL